MSDDQSFYEIHLNTPHLVLAFLGAVVVGMAFFYLGVIIGRGQGQAGISPDWESAAPAPTASTDEQEPLEFYQTVNESSADAAAQQEAGTQPGGGATAPASGFQPSEPVGSGEETPPAATPQTPAPQTSAPAAATAPPSGAAGVPQEDPSLVSGWVIQVRSTTEKTQAESLQAILAGAGFPAFVVSAEVQGRMWYRVRVGRYRTKADAAVIEARLARRNDVEQTWVTEG